MKTVTVNVSGLSDAALDWCVAKCEKRIYGIHGTMYEFQPSRYWVDGGHIMDREKIGYCWSSNGY